MCCHEYFFPLPFWKKAMTQERRRYGFVLERQCSIAKHWMAYHTTGKTVIDNNFENWQEIAASREIIPPAAYESGYSSSNGHNNNSGNMRRLVSHRPNSPSPPIIIPTDPIRLTANYSVSPPDLLFPVKQETAVPLYYLHEIWFIKSWATLQKRGLSMEFKPLPIYF